MSDVFRYFKVFEALADIFRGSYPILDSPIEHKMWKEFIAFGLVPVTQVSAGTFRTDIVLKFPAMAMSNTSARVVVELDGKSYHHGLVDDFRDDFLYANLRIPICHVQGNFAQYAPQLTALKIVDIFFPEMRDRANGSDLFSRYMGCFFRIVENEDVLNVFLRRAGLPPFGSRELDLRLNGRLGRHAIPEKRDVALALCRAKKILPFRMAEFTEGWISPWSSSEYSTYQSRLEFRQALGNAVASMHPLQLAREYARWKFTGVQKDRVLSELAAYEKRRHK